MAFVSILAPLIRRFPRALTETAGRTAWLSVLLSALPLTAALLAFFLLYRKRPAGGGFSAVMAEIIGPFPARVLSALYALWLIFYAGFLLRSGAIRFVSTVYYGAGPWLFVVVMALLCALAAMGPLKVIARSAMIFRPMMIAVFAFVFLLTAKNLDLSLLIPVTRSDLIPNGKAALQSVSLLSVVFYLAFLGDRLEGKFVLHDFVGWLAVMLGIIGLMTVSCIAVFGYELTSKMSFPFFMLARDVTVLGSLERLEAVVIAIWVLSDFVLISLLFQISAKNLRFCFSVPESDACHSLADLRGGRWLIPVCIVIAAVTALLIAKDVSGFDVLQKR